jgi:hypothetical protein
LSDQTPRREWGSSVPPPAELVEDPRERAYRLSQSGAPAFISGDDFLQVLARAGVIAAEDRIRRVVIDASVDGAVLLYTERYGDERMLSIETTLRGVQMRVHRVESDVVDTTSSSEAAGPRVYQPGVDSCPVCAAAPNLPHQDQCEIGLWLEQATKERAQVPPADSTESSEFGG